MTLYEILAIVSPVLTIIVVALVSYVFKSINENMKDIKDSVKSLDNRFGHLEKETYFIKGLLEGKNMSR